MTQPAESVTVTTSGGMQVVVESTGVVNVNPAPVPTPTPTPVPVPVPVAGASVTEFFEDFTGPAGTLPSSASWNVINTTAGPQNPAAFGGGDQEQYLANPALVAQDGKSNLVFTVGAQGSLGADAGYWPSGRVDSYAAPGQFSNGTFVTHGAKPKVAVFPGQSVEFSALVTPLAGLWPSLWFCAPGVTGGAYPMDYYEFDLMESGNWGGGGALSNPTAWGPGATAQQNLSSKVGTARTPFNLGDGKYHSYRLDYFTDHLAAYIDGILQYTIMQSQVNAAYGVQTGLNTQFGGQEWPYNQPSEGLCIVMNCAVNNGVVGSTPAAASLPHEVMAVDYVRVYSPAGPYVA